MARKQSPDPHADNRQLGLFEPRASSLVAADASQPAAPEPIAAPAPPPTAPTFGALADETPDDPSVVPRQASGIPYQVRYAALRALDLQADESLGVEQLDDVSIRGRAGIKLIQVKDEGSDVNDLNRGLWKALAHWARRLKNTSLNDNPFNEFVFVTTSKISGNLPQALANMNMPKREDYIERCISSLHSDDDDVRRSIEEVKSLDNERRRELINRTSIHREVSANDLRLKIVNKLMQLTFYPDTTESVANEYEGWFKHKTLTATSKNRGAIFRDDDIRTVLRNMRDRWTRRKVRYRHRKTRFSTDELSSKQSRLFFRQLQAIQLPSRACNDAVDDYLRHELERIVLTNELIVDREEFGRFDDDLCDSWRHEFNDVANTRSLNDEENGRQLYNSIMDSHRSPQLAGEVPPAYVYRGSYHRLADLPQLGWHPQWEKLFGDELSTSPEDAPEPKGQHE